MEPSPTSSCNLAAARAGPSLHKRCVSVLRPCVVRTHLRRLLPCSRLRSAPTLPHLLRGTHCPTQPLHPWWLHVMTPVHSQSSTSRPHIHVGLLALLVASRLLCGRPTAMSVLHLRLLRALSHTLRSNTGDLGSKHGAVMWGPNCSWGGPASAWGRQGGRVMSHVCLRQYICVLASMPSCTLPACCVLGLSCTTRCRRCCSAGQHGWRVEISRRAPGGGRGRDDRGGYDDFRGGRGGGGGRGEMRCVHWHVYGGVTSLSLDLPVAAGYRPRGRLMRWCTYTYTGSSSNVSRTTVSYKTSSLADVQVL